MHKRIRRIRITIWQMLNRLKTGVLRGQICAKDVAPLVNVNPIAVHYTPNSLLYTPTDHKPRFIGKSPRLATCSGVAWFHGDHIATVNLVGNALHIYRFDQRNGKFIPIQALVDLPSLACPENLAFSADGSLLAITNSRDGAVNLYTVDKKTHLVTPEPITTIRCENDRNTHGVSFSPCSQFFAYTTVDWPGCVRLFQIPKDISNNIDMVSVQELPNNLGPLKAKGIDFSPNGRFVAMCHAPNAGMQKTGHRGGLLCIYKFSKERGINPVPVSSSDSYLELHNPDDVKYFHDGSHLVVTNQAADTAIIVSVDKETGKLGEQQMSLTHARSTLYFPHGCGFSCDGQYLAIASYGDDKISIYSVQTEGNVMPQ
jgi:6-phosphogluconolactonase (cycloisomerase 2 family)